jgi:predicted Zn-dependent peptidase
VVREVLDNGLRLITERMPQVRSVTIGVWLMRGSRHESDARSGIAHFVEHMLFKGTNTRSAEDIAQAIDSIGGQLDAFTAKEYASYYIKVLDEHLPLAVDLLSDIVLRPAFPGDELEREKKVILEEIKMVEDTPDDLVHEVFTQHFWEGHPLGRPILGSKETVESFTVDSLRQYFDGAYVAPNMIISAAGNLEHAQVRELVGRAFASLSPSGEPLREQAPTVVPQAITRTKELEQSHLCLGTNSYPQRHDDRYVSYILNTVLGGSMSSRLFQNVREKRGLVYSISSGVTSYSDAGILSVYAGTSLDSVDEVLRLTLAELRRLMGERLTDHELRHAKDHLKGSLMLSLESTGSRMSHLARQEIYFGRHFGLDEIIEGIESVDSDHVQKIANEVFSGGLTASVLGNLGKYRPRPAQLQV